MRQCMSSRIGPPTQRAPASSTYTTTHTPRRYDRGRLFSVLQALRQGLIILTGFAALGVQQLCNTGTTWTL